MSGMAWSYEDSCGIPRIGVVETTSDRGGTDVTYFLRRDTGELDVVSGSLIARNAHPLGYALQSCRDCGVLFPFDPDADRCVSCVAESLGEEVTA